ncbi:MAG TPA: hypothetical protein VN223_13075, partial [Candidatus Elarobacter sp.]|nr:hypothetical protein [Candidatus Elarobacter sp.]
RVKNRRRPSLQTSCIPGRICREELRGQTQARPWDAHIVRDCYKRKLSIDDLKTVNNSEFITREIAGVGY